jgi:hypothetical protein
METTKEEEQQEEQREGFNPLLGSITAKPTE